MLLLPGGQLPLNIFEPRYLAMTRDALAGARMIGMVQPREGTGDARRCRRSIADRLRRPHRRHSSETDDGRYLITLAGVARFDIAEELPRDAALSPRRAGLAALSRRSRR